MSPNEIEAANRAEATSLLIRKGYRVYRPEADVSGEDLVLRTPKNELIAVQLKSRVIVSWAKYGGKDIWMLFPDSSGDIPGRDWFLIEHDVLFARLKDGHGTADCWDDAWSSPTISKGLREYLQPFLLRHIDRP